MPSQLPHYAGNLNLPFEPGVAYSEDVLQYALDMVRSHLKFSEGFTSVKPSGFVLGHFRREAYSNDVMTLVRSIRYLCRYEMEGDSLYSYIGENGKKSEIEINKQLLVEKTLMSVIDSYGDARRPNGDYVLVHVLQAALTVAAVYATAKHSDRVAVIEVVATLLHDIIEDTEDNENGMRNVKFRTITKNGRAIELEDKVRIYSFISESYGKYYGPEIVKLLKLLTRPKKQPGESLSLSEKIENYVDYYHLMLSSDLRASVMKFGDANSNKESTLRITEPAMLAKKKESIYKIIPQIIALDKLSYVMKEILLYGYREVAEGTQFDFDRIFRVPSPADVKNLRNGYVIINSPRANSIEMLGLLPQSGSPVLTYFSGGVKPPELSIQFCASMADAEMIVNSAGMGLIGLRATAKVMPGRVDNEMMFSLVSPSKINPVELLEKCVPVYDDYLRSHPNLQIFRSFNRRHAASAARQLSETIKAKDRKLLTPFKRF